MKLKIANRVVSTLIILTNIYFIPLNYNILREINKPLNYELWMLPIILSTNLMLISAGLIFTNKFKRSMFLFVLNSLGLLWNLFWLGLLLN